MKNKNSLVKFIVIFGIICAAAVAVAAIIARMQNKLACSCDGDENEEDEGCTGNCSDCNFCDSDDVENVDGEEETEETEIISETETAEEE